MEKLNNNNNNNNNKEENKRNVDNYIYYVYL